MENSLASDVCSKDKDPNIGLLESNEDNDRNDDVRIHFDSTTTFTLPNTDINDIKVMKNGLIVIADYHWQHAAVVTCDIKGNDMRRIEEPSGGRPFGLDVMDDDNVVVSLPNKGDIMFVDVKRGVITGYMGCSGTNIVYRYGDIYTQSDDIIYKTRKGGQALGTITPFDFRPLYLSATDNGALLYCTVRDRNELICMDSMGVTRYGITAPLMMSPHGITFDDQGFIYVVSAKSQNVHLFHNRGIPFQRIICLPSKLKSPTICFHSDSKSIIIGDKDRVFVYKKELDFY